MDEKERALRRWFEAWLTNDGSCIGELFAPDAVYSECWGPVYRGRAQIARWFADWNAGGRVLAWRIGRVLCAGAGAAAEWYFECEHDGHAAFNGVTLADFGADGKIVSLREFRSDPAHVFPYGDA
ncbi:MAG: nuclear transport factor 2 family protein [Oscillospiraceae bacterium]|nr:nuclear transport factor 2 family protein [Oscillospiraceae bacterium]